VRCGVRRVSIASVGPLRANGVGFTGTGSVRASASPSIQDAGTARSSK